LPNDTKNSDIKSNTSSSSTNDTKVSDTITSKNTSTTNASTTNTSNRIFRDVGKKPENTQIIKNVKIENDNENKVSLNELKKISKNNWRAQIETGFIASIFGSTFAYILYYIMFAISLAFRLFILFIIFNICVIIYKGIQLALDVSHTVMGGVKKSLSDINGFLNKVGMDFTIPGVNLDINALGIHWHSGDIARINWFPFTNSLGKPISEVTRADNAFPRDALDVIIFMIRDMLVGLIDKLPKMLEGMIQIFEKIMK